jgi:hypothetical protein
MRKLKVTGLGIVLGLTCVAYGATWGEFKGTVRAEWLDDGRRMRLLDEFQYIDPVGQKWVAPKDAVIDGASIPRVFWSFIGGPYEGRYRNASVVHDVACAVKKEPWQKVHLMFYSAARLGGVGEVSGKTMYGAVYHFGPRWQNPPAYTLKDDADFLRMREYIRRNSAIPLEAIEKLTPGFLRDMIPEVPRPIRIPADDK